MTQYAASMRMWHVRATTCTAVNTGSPAFGACGPSRAMTLLGSGRRGQRRSIKQCSPDGAKRNPGSQSAKERPPRIPLRSMRATGEPALHFRFTCQIARSQRCAARCKRVPGHPWSSFPFPPKGMGAPRPASKFNNLSALLTRTRVLWRRTRPASRRSTRLSLTPRSFRNFGPGEH